MKVSFQCFLWGLLPILGFIACQNKNNESSPPKSGQTINVLQDNKQHTKFSRIKHLDVTEALPVNFNNDGFQVQSSCQSNRLHNFSTTVPIYKNQTLVIKDILPLQVFTPFKEPPQWFCDFKISLIKDHGQKINNKEILLKQIQVKGIHLYSDLKLPNPLNQKTDQLSITHKEELVHSKLVKPIKQGNIITLCQDSSQQRVFNSLTSDVIDLFDEKIFKKSHLTLCRLVVQQPKPQKNWVSSAFFIQKEKPKLSYHYRHHYTARVNNYWGQRPLGVLTIINEGQEATDLKLLTPVTSIYVTGVYSNPSKPGENYYANTLEIVGVWSVEQAPYGQSQDQWGLYQLKPGQSLNLSLYTDDRISCQTGEPIEHHGTLYGLGPSDGDSNPFFIMPFEYDGPDQALLIPDHIKTKCLEKFYLSGMFYHIREFPQVHYNLFLSMNYKNWKNLYNTENLQTQQSEPDHLPFSTWVPNHLARRYCPGLDIKKNIINFPRKNKTINTNFIGCHLH